VSSCPAANVNSGQGHDLELALGLAGANEIQVNGVVLQIQANIINGSGGDAGLTKTGAGRLVLSGSTETYTGNTTINAGALALEMSGSAAASINHSALLAIAAGATFDVSGIATFNLSSNTTLSASGSGTTVGLTAAEIRGGSIVALGDQPVTLNYDGSDPALFISQGVLSLHGNQFTVNSTAPLADGAYTLVRQAGGNIVTNSGFPTATGTGIRPGSVGFISVSGGDVMLNVLTAATIRVETAADGSGMVVPAQNLAAGGSLTVYAIARAANGAFVSNVAASWYLPTLTGGVANGDLVPAGDGRSATFTGHRVGSASIHATANGWISTDSGTLTVVPGPAMQVGVETAVDGSGTVVPAQIIPSGQAITVYAITRDAWTNFVANAPANSWTVVNNTGGVQTSNLSPGSGPVSTFTASASGTGKISANIGGLNSVVSGAITVVPDITLLWSAAPANYQWDTTSTNWSGGAGVFANGNFVQFTDGGSASSPIVLEGALGPASVVVNTATNNYTFGGSGCISGASSLMKNGSSSLIIDCTNTYTGGTILAGNARVTANAAAAFGTGTVTVGSGSGIYLRTGNPANNFAISGNGWTGDPSPLGALRLNNGITVSGTVTLNGNSRIWCNYNGSTAYTASVAGSIGDGGNGYALDTGGYNSNDTLVLSGANTYTGATTISAGTLALGAGGSLSNSPALAIAAGATFDVSAFSTYTLSRNTSLSASGAGISVGATAAAIKGAAGGTVNLGAQPITLTYDGSDPALFISQGVLSLNGNQFTVNATAPLTNGAYLLVRQASGSISSASGFPAVTGSALGPGQAGSLSVSGGNLMLTVSGGGTTISVTKAADGNYSILCQGVPNSYYALDQTASLAAPLSWTPVVTNQASAAGQVSFTLTPSGGAGFYRTRYVP